MFEHDPAARTDYDSAVGGAGNSHSSGADGRQEVPPAAPSVVSVATSVDDADCAASASAIAFTFIQQALDAALARVDDERARADDERARARRAEAERERGQRALDAMHELAHPERERAQRALDAEHKAATSAPSRNTHVRCRRN